VNHYVIPTVVPHMDIVNLPLWALRLREHIHALLPFAIDWNTLFDLIMAQPDAEEQTLAFFAFVELTTCPIGEITYSPTMSVWGPLTPLVEAWRWEQELELRQGGIREGHHA